MIITIEEAFMIQQIRNLPPEARSSINDLLSIPKGEEQIKAIIAAERIKNKEKANQRKRHIIEWDQFCKEPTRINRLLLVDKNERKKTDLFISRIWEKERGSQAAFDRFRKDLVSVTLANEEGRI